MSLGLPLGGGFIYLSIIPTRFHQSGYGEFISGRISPFQWLIGGALVFACVAACIETFRRGSRADRVMGCFASLLTLWLISEFFSLVLLPVRPSAI